MSQKATSALKPRTLSNFNVIEQVACSSLRVPSRKLRRAAKTLSAHLQAGLQQFGQNIPILADDKGGIIYGEFIYEAAITLGWKTVNVIRIGHLTASEIRKYRLFLDKITDMTEWDTEALNAEIQEIALLDPDVRLEIPGFELAEIDIALSNKDEEQDVDEDDLAPATKVGRHSVCRTGDLWQLGDHLLIVGDALLPQTYENLLSGIQAQLVITDPPFNVPIHGHVSGLGTIRHAEFAVASGEMSEKEFREFLREFLRLCAASTCDGALFHVVMDWRHMKELLGAAQDVGLTHINLCVWVKTNAGMGSLYRSQHELVFVFKNGTASHVNNVQLGKYGRNRTNVWTYPGMNTFHAERDELLAAHPTVKPVAMIADAIRDCSNRGDVILDPFAGSGTVFLAAERTGRRAFGIEIDPEYCEVAIDRWETKTGQMAVHTASGLTREELKAQRPKARHRERPGRKARSYEGVQK